jgi:hypothetical protein
MSREGSRADAVASWLKPGAAHGYSYEPQTPLRPDPGSARRERLPAETSCHPARRRFDVPSDVPSDLPSGYEHWGESTDDNPTFDFVPMHEETPESVPEEILVCQPPSVSPGMGPIRVSSELGYAHPRPSSWSSEWGYSGSSSLRVSTSSFCSSLDTIVDADSDYRVQGRADRKKHSAEEIGAAVAAAAAAAAAAADSAPPSTQRAEAQSTRPRAGSGQAPGHGLLCEDTVFISRPTAPRAARSARPPPVPASDAHRPAMQRPIDADDKRRVGNGTGECRRTERSAHRHERALQAGAPVARSCTKNFYPAALCGDVSSAQTASAAAIWNRPQQPPSGIGLGRLTSHSELLPTDGYDYTMKLALSKIQQYR